jgi:cell shape-determining protein MreC
MSTQALEQRVAELEEENEKLRQALNLSPSSRPIIGTGPTGQYHADKTQHQIISPSGESAGSPSSYASSPETGHIPPYNDDEC